MKFSYHLILPAVASAAVLQPRVPQDPQHAQHAQQPSPAGQGTRFAAIAKAEGYPAAIKALPRAKLVEVQSIAPKIRPDAKRTISKYGPYKIVGKNETKPESFTSSADPMGQAFMEIIPEGLCKNCTVLTGAARLTKTDGTIARSDSGIYLHHAVSFDTTRPVNLPMNRCSSPEVVALGSEFIAQGDDGLNGNNYFTSRTGESNTGYHVGADLAVLIIVDVVNSNEQAQEIYVTYEIEYLEGNVGADARSTLMSVTTCNKPGQPNYDPKKEIKLDPNGPAVTESAKVPFTRDGRIVSASAHMHSGGDEMILSINGQPVCNSKAVYAPIAGTNMESIAYNQPCKSDIPFKKGDYLSISAVYDLSKHPIRAGGEHTAHGGPDVMGTFYLTLTA